MSPSERDARLRELAVARAAQLREQALDEAWRRFAVLLRRAWAWPAWRRWPGGSRA